MDWGKRNDYLYWHHRELWVAVNHHRTHTGKPITFQDRNYLKQIFLDQSENICIRKSSQCGISEWLVIRAMVAASTGRSIFYVLPTLSLQSRFVRNRVDKSIEHTPYYKSLIYTDVYKRIENVSLKRVGNGVIAFVGSNSESAFVEFPADELVIDELDRCTIDNLGMAESRLSNCENPRRVKVSNPSVEGYGIDAEYERSDKKEWYIPCSSCGKIIQPDFFRHVVRQGESENDYYVLDPDWDEGSSRDIRPICDKCHRPFDRFVDGEWVAQAKSQYSGYQISKMFSTKVKMVELVDQFNEGLENPSKLQIFYNFGLGFALTQKGAKITFKELDDCIEDYGKAKSLQTGERTIMGVDVGTWLHWIVGRLTPERRVQILAWGRVKDEEELLDVARKFNSQVGVIDSLPEMRISRKVCRRLKYWLMCVYAKTRRMKINEHEKSVTVDRTESLDEVKETIITKRLILPKGARNEEPMVWSNGIQVSELYQHLTASTRVFDEARQVYDWVHTEPDHLYHSLNYLIIASKIFLRLRR